MPAHWKCFENAQIGRSVDEMFAAEALRAAEAAIIGTNSRREIVMIYITLYQAAARQIRALALF